MSQNQRQSNIELLRCFAMLCIIVYHLCLFACYLLQCPAILWKNCFEHPIQYIYGFANEPWQILPIMVWYAAAAMLIMGSIDKVLNPMWNRLVAFAAKYDEKWNTKQLR